MSPIILNGKGSLKIRKIRHTSSGVPNSQTNITYRVGGPFIYHADSELVLHFTRVPAALHLFSVTL